MKCTFPLPCLWLFTDERLGGAHADDPLWRAIRRLPAGAGLVFRHYGLPDPERRALLQAVARVARARRLLLVVSTPPRGTAPANRHWPAGLVGRGGRARGVQTAAAHNRREVEAAARAGADLLFLSPVFPTRSHADSAAMGAVRFGLIARSRSRRAASLPVMAMGGMNAARGRRMRAAGAAGWAAIDAWAGVERQVPRQVTYASTAFPSRVIFGLKAHCGDSKAAGF